MKPKKIKVVGVIPARGGSSGVSNKNLRLFSGKPLIAWSILSALESNLDRVIVCTNDLKIGKVAQKYGAEVITEPHELALGTMGIEPVVRYVYEWLLKKENYKADALALLMATSPSRNKFHINDGIDIFKKSRADSVVGVNQTPANHTPYWTLIRSPKGKVTLFDGAPLKKILTRRQDFPKKCYARNDLIYILKPKNLYDKERIDLYGAKVELYETSTLYEMDINTPDEWSDAEIKFKRLLKNKKKPE